MADSVKLLRVNNRKLRLVLPSVVLLCFMWATTANLSYAQPRTGDNPHLSVLVDVNLRAGPGMTNAVVGRANAGDEYLVLDQAQACGWLQIAARDDPQQAPLGWISGHPAYVELSAPCAAIGATPTPPLLPTPTADVATTVSNAAVDVTVLIDGAPIRSAPTSAGEIVRAAAAGETLRAVGQVRDCKWLRVVALDGVAGWLSGNPAYSQLAGTCADLPSLEPPTPTPTPAPQLIVLIADVNIRDAASTQARVLRTAALDETFAVTGQTNNCTWFQIALDDAGGVGWISGNKAYTQVDQPCAALAVVAATPTPRPTAASARTAQGCATVTNLLGFTVRIDIRRSDGWQTSFSLAPNASRYACVEAGTYTATLSSPSRTDRLSVPLFVRGGENYTIPLQMP